MATTNDAGQIFEAHIRRHAPLLPAATAHAHQTHDHRASIRCPRPESVCMRIIAMQRTEDASACCHGPGGRLQQWCACGGVDAATCSLRALYVCHHCCSGLLSGAPATGESAPANAGALHCGQEGTSFDLSHFRMHAL